MRFEHTAAAIELSTTCIDTFEAHRQRTWLHKETGGQLFARFYQGCFIVEHAICVQGTQSRYSFWPNRNKEQDQIDALFKDNLHYVGDWHTHPEKKPTPSKSDRIKMLEIFKQSKHELPFMVMAIVGTEPFPNGLFVATVSSSKIQKMSFTEQAV